MTTSRSHRPREWSLGAVLAEREVDPQTSVLVVSGHTTVIVDLNGADRVTDAILAALMQGRRKLNGARGGRLVVAADDPSLRNVLERLGFELDGVLETT